MLATLLAPTLLVYGDTDLTSLARAVDVFDVLADAQLAVVPGTTHFGLIRRAELLAPILTRFFDGAP